MPKPQILLTNDDGIQSPGLWAAAEALSALGFLYVVAPRDQFSAGAQPAIHFGRHDHRVKSLSMITSDGLQRRCTLPRRSVWYAEIMPTWPDLVVSGTDMRTWGLRSPSRTVGGRSKRLHKASSLAVSLRRTSPTIELFAGDFQPSAYFTSYSSILLEKKLPADVDVLKIDVPQEASVTTPWQVTCLTRQPYFTALPPARIPGDSRGPLGYGIAYDPDLDSPDTDAYVVRKSRLVSVTPLSLDLTSRVDLRDFRKLLEL
jgi:5'-nucleotidase